MKAFVILWTTLSIDARPRRLDVLIRGEQRALSYDDEHDDVWALASTFATKQNVTSIAEDVQTCGIDVAVDQQGRFSCTVSVLVELMRKSPLGGEDEAEAGCPQSYAPSASVRLLVAVPSAAGNSLRRSSIRRTWCRRLREFHGSQLTSTRVLFIVGAVSAEAAAVEAESQQFGDVLSVSGLKDAATNVVNKLLASLKLARDSNYTHYARVEDDVYLFADRLAFRLLFDPAAVVLARFARERTDYFELEYPRGFAVVLPGGLAASLGSTHADFGFGIKSQGDATLRPPAAKGGWVRGRWWNDDAFLGLLLYPYDIDYVNEPGFHDLPGRGPSSNRVSHASLAVNAVQSHSDFDAVHAARRPDALGIAHTWSVTDHNTLKVEAHVDATLVHFTLARPTAGDCKADATKAARLLCIQFPHLPQAECDNALVALFAVCAEADADFSSSWTAGYRAACILENGADITTLNQAPLLALA